MSQPIVAFDTAGATRPIVSGLAFLGRIRLALMAIIFTIVALVAVGYGYKHMYDKKKLTGKTSGKIDSHTCTSKGDCSGTVSYTVNGKTFTKSVHLDATQIQSGSVNLWYDPNNPQHAEVFLLSIRSEMFIIVFATIAVVVAWGLFYLARRYRWFAAVEGGLGLASLLH